MQGHFKAGFMIDCRRRRWQSRRKWERVDSALAYSGQEILTQSLPAVRKYPGDALADSAEGQQNLSSIYLATESAPASPFGSTHPVHPQVSLACQVLTCKWQ